jgi:hypothetical protein
MDENIISESVNKLFNTSTNNYIFIYTPPKVGSTTLVTSLRVSLGKTYNIIHIHDETMMRVLTGINNVKINDIINFLSNKGENVYVIDVYRTPIERKISEFFEKISPYHFNNTTDNISKYSIERISDRFNKIFPHIENGDHYFEKYDILNPIPFDFEKKYTVQSINNIKYIKLRLCDSGSWASILSNVFQTDIVIIHDYKTADKSIGQLYNNFKNEYKLPSNYLDIVKNDKYFNFYYNELERNNYLNTWKNKSTSEFIPYNESEYKFYINLCLENQYINDIDIHHYIDNGCFCILCNKKRRDIYFKAKAGEKSFDKIIHSEVIVEAKNEKIKEINEKINKINKRINNVINKQQKFKPKQFKINTSL